MDTITKTKEKHKQKEEKQAQNKSTKRQTQQTHWEREREQAENVEKNPKKLAVQQKYVNVWDFMQCAAETGRRGRRRVREYLTCRYPASAICITGYG